MAFKTYAVNSSASAEKKSDVNWADLNNYIVETCGLQERETLVGYVSSIVDLGIQKLADAEYVSDIEEDSEEDYIEEHPGVYFKDGFDPETRKPARLKCVPQRDQQAVALSIDFPDIMLDKGQFFGESNLKPLRIWLGGQFYTQANGMILGRPTPLRITNLDKTKKTKKWSFAKNHLFYKMAVASKQIKVDECFLPQDIDKLLGEAFQFEVQVYFKKGNDGKEYFSEYIKFVGGLGRGQKAPELVTEPFIIQFDEKNSIEHLKEVRSHIINTMKMAKNFEGSAIQKQLEGISKSREEVSDNTDNDTPQEPPKKEENKPVKPKAASKKVPEPIPEDDMDDDLPFN